MITSSNLPHFPYPDLYNGKDVIKRFRDMMLNTASKLSDPKLAEWRYEGIHLYPEQEVNFIFQNLISKGFEVILQAPHITVETSSENGKPYIHSSQSIIVRIPKDASVNEDAVLQKHNSYQEQLSVHNILVKSRDSHEKIDFPSFMNVLAKTTTITVEQLMEQISKELTFVASQDPLVKCYAFRIDLLDNAKQNELVNQLRGLGYSANLDCPFIEQHFVGILNGFCKNFTKQYVLIDLP